MGFQRKAEFYSYDAAPDGSVKLSALMRQFQQIARENLDSFGVTYPLMRDHDQIFVILKIRIEFLKPFTIYDETYIETVPTKVVGVTFYRDFRVRDASGNICALSTSTWVLIDYKDRSILRPSALVVPCPGFPDEAVDLPLHRRFTFDESPLQIRTDVLSVRYSRLDENNHLNNTEIAALASDEFADRIVSGERLKSFELHFEHEAVLHDLLRFEVSDYSGCTYVTAVKDGTGEPVFSCLAEFQDQRSK